MFNRNINKQKIAKVQFAGFFKHVLEIRNNLTFKSLREKNPIHNPTRVLLPAYQYHMADRREQMIRR